VDAGNEVGANVVREDGDAEGNLDESRVRDNVGLEEGAGGEVVDGLGNPISAKVAFSRA